MSISKAEGRAAPPKNWICRRSCLVRNLCSKRPPSLSSRDASLKIARVAEVSWVSILTELSRNGMNAPPFFRVAQRLIAIGLTALAGCSHSETMVGTSGPLRAFRTQAFLGWEIIIKNDSDVTYPALYDINLWTSLKHVPAHGTVKAGYVLGREIPTFDFAQPPLRGPDYLK
jgi:hypothetical protein